MKFYEISHPRLRQQWFETFDPLVQTWIVPDIRSKLDLQNRLLQRHGWIPEESVLRSGELWKKSIQRQLPEYQFISQSLALVLVQRWLKPREAWVQAPGVAPLALNYLSIFLPVLSAEQGPELMTAWLKRNSEAFERWGHWFIESYFLWQQFLTHKWLLASWAPSLLIHLGVKPIVSRDLICDLGLRIQPSELELFRQMSNEASDVEILVPFPSWQTEYQGHYSAYEQYKNPGHSFERVTEDLQTQSLRQYKRLTTQLGEVKEATAQVRQWLDSGVAANQIAVVAPQVHEYETSLKSYFHAEGISLQKLGLVSFNSLPSVQQWLADLKLCLTVGGGASSELNAEDLEAAIYLENKKPNLSYEQFHYLYSIVFNVAELSRSPQVYERWVDFEKTKKFQNQEFKRDEIFEWMLLRWTFDDQETLSRIAEAFMKETPKSLVLSPREWIQHLKVVCQRGTLHLEDIHLHGVKLLELHGADSFEGTHLAVLGLTDQSLKKSSSLSLLQKDVNQIANDLGFQLGSLEDQKLEFEAKWLVEDFQKTFLLTCASSDFSGEPHSPSFIWIQGAKQQGAVHEPQAPRSTRWDDIHQNVFEYLEAQGASTQLLQHAFEEDVGLREKSSFASNTIKKLSASALEDYLNCPFVFAAKRVFRLSDEEELDLSVDRRKWGSLTHYVLEHVLQEKLETISDSKILSIIDQGRKEIALVLFYESSWETIKSRLLKLSRQFIEVELEDQKESPQRRHIAFEVPIKGYLSPEGELDSSPQAYEFRGKIDRIDDYTDAQNKHYAVVYDYKNTGAQCLHWSKWGEQNKIQLFLYAEALERGLVESIESRPVAGSFYYILKNFHRRKGFLDRDKAEVLGLKASHHALVTQEQRIQMKDDLNSKISVSLKSLEEGVFPSTPDDEQHCERCRWRRLCRGVHLL